MVTVLAQAAEQNPADLGLQQQERPCPQPGAWESEVRVWPGWAPGEAPSGW